MTGESPENPRLNFDALKDKVKQFNQDYPRPNMDPLELSNLTDTKPKNCPRTPGVYALFRDDGLLLYIGKVSCKRTIYKRILEHFSGDGKPKPAWRKGFTPSFIAWIQLPNDRAFEAPAIEEFLVTELKPPFNGVFMKRSPKLADDVPRV